MKLEISGVNCEVGTVLLVLGLIGALAQQSRAEEDRRADSDAVTDLQARVALRKKLDSIILPSVEFDDVEFGDALEFLREGSVKWDVGTANPENKGVNIIFPQGPGTESRITLKLTDVPLHEALRYTTALAQLQFEIEPHAVVINPYGDPGSDLLTNAYLVPSGFLTTEKGDSLKPDAVYSAKELLESVGIGFPAGSKAIFQTGTSQLIVRNTKDQMELVEAYIVSLVDELPEEERSKYLESWDNPEERALGKLEAIILPAVKFVDLPFLEAIGLLQKRSVDLDTETDPAKKGVNVTLEAGEDGRNLEEIKITLTLRNVSLAEALRYTCSLAGFEYSFESGVVVIRPLGSTH